MAYKTTKELLMECADARMALLNRLEDLESEVFKIKMALGLEPDDDSFVVYGEEETI